MRLGCDGLGYWHEEGSDGTPTNDTRLRRAWREYRAPKPAYDANVVGFARREQ